MSVFNTVTIIGIGLIGSSLARRIKADHLVEHLILVDKDESVCQKARDLGLGDEVTTDAVSAARRSRCVILASPVGAFGQIAQTIGPVLQTGTIVSDVGSVKAVMYKDVLPHLPEGVHMIPAHPIAGTEYSGPEAGFSTLFEDHWCVLTPDETTDLRALERLSALWQGCGARIEVMNYKHHDLVFGVTSHLPHLLAYTLVGTAATLEDDLKADVIKYCASGFQSTTRVAASDPVMWRDVFLANKDAVLDVLERFMDDLTALRKSIHRGDGFYLEEVFTRGREVRRYISQLGPEGYSSKLQMPRDKDEG